MSTTANRTFSFALLTALVVLGIWYVRAVPRVERAELFALSITPITSTSDGASGLTFVGDSYDVTCTVSTDTVTLYAAAHDGSAWRIYDGTACVLAVGAGRTCRFPADRQNGTTWNAYKTGAGSVASCTAQQSFGPIGRAPGGGGGGSGTVTSVAMTVPTGFAVTGSPITGAGTLAVSLSTQSAGYALIGPTSGSAAAPTFRALTLPDVPVKRLWYSPVDRGMQNTPNYNAGGDYTIGNVWMPTCQVTVTGCRFRTEATGARTIRCKLWDPAGVEQRSVDVATSGPGTYTGTFASAYEIATADVNKQHISSVYQTDGLGWTEASTDTANHPVAPFLIGANIMIFSFYNYAAGNNRPTSSYSGSYLPAEPVFAERSNC